MPLALVPHLGNMHFALVPILASLAWPPDGVTCISYKFGHQKAPLVLFQIWPPGWVTCIATLPWIALKRIIIILVFGSYLHQPESHQLSQQNSLTQFQTVGPIDRTSGIPGSNQNHSQNGRKNYSIRMARLGCIFPKRISWKCIFAKCSQLAHLLT